MYDFCCQLKHLLVGILFHNLHHPYIPLHFEEMIFPLVGTTSVEKLLATQLCCDVHTLYLQTLPNSVALSWCIWTGPRVRLDEDIVIFAIVVLKHVCPETFHPRNSSVGYDRHDNQHGANEETDGKKEVQRDYDERCQYVELHVVR